MDFASDRALLGRFLEGAVKAARALLSKRAVVYLNRPSLHKSLSPMPGRSAPRRISISFRWAVRGSALEMFPPVPKRSFKWSYVLARTLRRLHPGNLL